MPNPLRRSGRTTQILEPPPAIDPVTQRPYGTPHVEVDEVASSQIAAGQRALASLETPVESRIRHLIESGLSKDDAIAGAQQGGGFRRTVWLGAR